MLLDHKQPPVGSGHRTLYQQEIPLGIGLNHLQFLYGHTHVSHMTSHARALQDAARGGAGTDGAGRAVAIRLAMRFRAAAEAVALDATLEALTLAGTYNVNGFADLEKPRVKGLPQLQLLQRGPVLQSNFTQDPERAKLWTGPALAVLLNFQQPGDTFIWLLFFLLLGRLFATFLLIFLQALALRFQQGQLMPQVSQLGTRRALQAFLLKTNLDSFITIMGNGLDLCHDTWACFDHGYGYHGPVRAKYLSHADLSAQQSTEHILSSLLCRIVASLCLPAGARVADVPSSACPFAQQA